jgi:hypothetical protein
MKGCECKGGFFALRDCDQPVANTCTRCSRGVCSRHLSPASGFTECLDCWARERDEEQAEQQPNDDGSMPPPRKSVDEGTSLDEDWAYGYRHRYYRGGYRPLYVGTAAGVYYSTYDTRSFDRHSTSDGDSGYDDSGDGGFGDS